MAVICGLAVHQPPAPPPLSPPPPPPPKSPPPPPKSPMLRPLSQPPLAPQGPTPQPSPYWPEAWPTSKRSYPLNQLAKLKLSLLADGPSSPAETTLERRWEPHPARLFSQPPRQCVGEGRDAADDNQKDRHSPVHRSFPNRPFFATHNTVLPRLVAIFGGHVHRLFNRPVEPSVNRRRHDRLGVVRKELR